MPLYHRRSIRLPGYDYSQAGEYFITICVQNREHLFGKIIDGEMVLNDAGKMIEKWYLELSNKFTDIATDVYCVMPNHFHAIIVNTGKNEMGKLDNGNANVSNEHVGATLRGCPITSNTLGE
jgi:hypothetical protein